MGRARKASADSSATIGGFVGGIAGDAQITRQLNDAEFYYYVATHHPWIGAAVTMIAEALAADGYDVIAPGTDRDQAEVDADTRVAAMRTVFDAINERQSLLELVEELQTDYDITGRFYALKLRLPAGWVVGLERIDPRTIAPVLSADTRRIASFVQKVWINGVTKTKTYPASEVIYVARPGGTDVLGGPSILDQLDTTYAVDMSARKHNAAFFRNGCRAGDVYVNDGLTKDQAEKSERTIKDSNTNPENAYRPLVLAGKWQVFRAQAGTNDEEFSRGQDRALTEVCAVFHIPEGKLKNTDGTLGQAGKEADDQTFHEECVAPRARRLYRALTRELLLKEWGIADLALVPKAKYQYRLSNVDSALKLLQAGGTVTESRSVIGLPKLPPADGVNLDAPLVATTVTQYQDKADPLELAQARAATAPPFAPPRLKPPVVTGKKARRFHAGWREARNA